MSSSKEWKTYQEYIKKLQSKTPAEIDAVIDEYFPDVESSSVPQRFHLTVMEMMRARVSDAEGLEVLPKLYTIYTLLYPNLKTRRQKLSEIRKKFILKFQSKKLYQESQKDTYFNIDMGERIELTEAYKTEITEKNKDKFQIDLQDVLSKMQQLILSKNVYERGLCLLLAGGQRPIEMFYRNEVVPVKDAAERPNWVIVKNLAKKRQDEPQETTRPIVMLSAKQFIEELDRFRRHFKGKSVKVVDEKTGADKLAADKSSTMNKVALKWFPFLKDLHQQSSLMRKMHIDMSFQMYADTKKTNYNSWVSEKLGHNGLLTSFSYSWVAVRDKEQLKETQMNDKITMLEKKIDLLVAMTEKKTTEEAPYVVQPHTPKPRESDAEKFERLEKIYAVNPKISNSALRQKSRLGSKVVNSFLVSRKEKKEK
jgi:hypothetical protein